MGYVVIMDKLNEYIKEIDYICNKLNIELYSYQKLMLVYNLIFNENCNIIRLTDNAKTQTTGLKTVYSCIDEFDWNKGVNNNAYSYRFG